MTMQELTVDGHGFKTGVEWMTAVQLPPPNFLSVLRTFPSRTVTLISITPLTISLAYTLRGASLPLPPFS